MDTYDISFKIFNKTITKRVKATSLNAAWKTVENMSILSIIEGCKLKDFGMVYSGSSVEKKLKEKKYEQNDEI